MSTRLKNEQALLGRYDATLQAFNPMKTLARGFSILQDKHGEVIRSSGQVKAGERIHARLHQGKLNLEVSDKPD
jgi:exodeoxyribonuclease VII large subunit